MKRLLLILLLMLGIFANPSVGFSSTNPTITGILINGATFVPVRVIGEIIGYQVSWNSSSSTASLNTARVTEFKENSFDVIINGDKNHISVPPLLIKGSMYVPLRTISEALGAEVKWVSQNNTIILSDGNKSITMNTTTLPAAEQDYLFTSLTQKLSNSTEILLAAKAVYEEWKDYTVLDLTAVINKASFIIDNGNSLFTFYLEPVNMTADVQFAIVSKVEGTWNCAWTGNYFDPTVVEDKYWEKVYDSSKMITLPRSIIINFANQSVYLANGHVKSWDENHNF